jgi:hypothetical protein
MARLGQAAKQCLNRRVARNRPHDEILHTLVTALARPRDRRF